MAKRRTKGEGGIYQRHDHPSCPPLIDGERAEHRCRGRWTAQVDLGWHGPAGARKRRRKTIYGPTKAAVQVELAKALRDKEAGALIVKSPTVEQWMTHWLDVICVERGLRINTMKSHRSKAKQYIVPHLGRRRLDKLQPEHVRAMYAAMRKDGLAESTLRQTHAILRRALEVALREGKVARNVAAMIDPPSTKKGKRKGLPLDKARMVLRLAEGARWHVALYLGPRQGECLAARWSKMDLSAGVWHIDRELVRNSDPTNGIPVGLVLDEVKSEAGERYLPLPTVVLSRLKVAHAEWAADRPEPAKVYDVVEGEWIEVDDLVFANAGRPIDHRADWSAWSQLLETAEVPHIALHAARNTAGSLLEEAGVPDRVVAQILGQATVQVTHGYQHAEVERLRDAMRSLEDLVETGGQQPPELPRGPHGGTPPGGR